MSGNSEKLSAGLRRQLEPFREFLRADDVEELFINRPGEVFVKTSSQTCRRLDMPDLTYDELQALTVVAGNARALRFDEGAPLLSTALPRDPAFIDCQLRFTAVRPPCVEPGYIIVALRKQSLRDLTLSDLAGAGLFNGTTLRGRYDGADDRVGVELAAAGFEVVDVARRKRKRALPPVPGAAEAAAAGDAVRLLGLLVKARRNIAISGATGAGKTTVLNACVREIPDGERFISIEDAREVRSLHANRVHLLSMASENASIAVTPRDLLKHTLRLSPQRIALSEVRGAEAYPFLESVNTGHPGSLTTLHADSIEDAKTRLAMAAARAFDGLRDEHMRQLVDEYVDVFVHIRAEPSGRFISDIEYV